MNKLLHLVVAAAEATYGTDSVMSKIAIAQAQQESNVVSKPSKLAVQANNLFGIKGSGTAGSVLMRTHEYVNGKKIYINAPFAKNATLADSFEQHKKLMSKPRYAKVLAAQTFQDAAQALKDAGYATDPNYPANLLGAYLAVEKRT